MKMVSKFKAQKTSGCFSGQYGIGRSTNHGHCQDFFLLQKGNNLPELVFNQDSGQDKNIRKRFFEYDYYQKWKVSNNNNRKDKCYVCEKKKYSLIFYERNEQANNDLIEIKDQDFLQKCRAEYNLKFS